MARIKTTMDARMRIKVQIQMMLTMQLDDALLFVAVLLGQPLLQPPLVALHLAFKVLVDELTVLPPTKHAVLTTLRPTHGTHTSANVTCG